jgi:hypothetical protein
LAVTARLIPNELAERELQSEEVVRASA